jgi:hypothetical protein
MPETFPSKTLATMAIVISGAAVGISGYFAHLQVRTTVLPVLVFVYDSAGWELKNVGSGPAIDPIVSHQEHNSDKWLAPTRVYPIEGSGGKIRLLWVGHNPDKIIVYYRDAHGNAYVSKVDDDRTLISYGEIPPVWDSRDVLRIWEREALIPKKSSP